MVEGKHDSAPEDAIVSRVPVVSANGTPLMPCKPAKARKLLESGKARKQWSKLGIFYIQLHFNPTNPTAQPLVIGVDPGSKFEGFSIVGTQDTVLNMMSEAVTWVSRTVKQRKQMRMSRRYRNTRRRPCRSNRSRGKRFIPPSTKARWGAKLRVITHLKTILPIKTVVVEDIKARSKKGQRKWNRNFSPLERGKEYFYQELRKMGLVVILRTGFETQALRERFNLRKVTNKSKPIFESHCVDAWVLAASETGAQRPTTKSLYYAIPLRWHRRQLHYLQPSKGGVRRRYGGTMSLGLKRGTLVKHAKFGFCYVGGTMNGKLSLHSVNAGMRLTRNGMCKDFKILTRVSFRTQFLFQSKLGGFTGGYPMVLDRM
jgi:hypothetical protein